MLRRSLMASLAVSRPPGLALCSDRHRQPILHYVWIFSFCPSCPVYYLITQPFLQFLVRSRLLSHVLFMQPFLHFPVRSRHVSHARQTQSVPHFLVRSRHTSHVLASHFELPLSRCISAMVPACKTGDQNTSWGRCLSAVPWCRHVLHPPTSR